MKTLFLLRHAKSEPASAGLSDFERTLNDRGRADAALIGNLVRDRELGFDSVVSSPAIRARETTELVLKAAELGVGIRLDPQVYEAEALHLLKVVNELDPEAEAAVLVGHNPGMSELLQLLTSDSQSLSTATLAKIDLNVSDWEEVKVGSGKVDWAVRAKDLRD